MELIELLNNTSPARVIFYSIVFLIAINIIGYYVSNVILGIFKRNK